MDESVQKASQGLLKGLKGPNGQMAALSERQTELADAVSFENDKLTGATTGLQPMIDKTALYLEKLRNINKEMQRLSEKSDSMKVRALKLQEAKQNEALMREQRLQQEKEREDMLTAKPEF